MLAAARRGDRSAFDALVGRHRRELHVHCYRMLGSVEDAEDTVQETMLRAWRGIATFDGTWPLRSWLYRIATNRCLTLSERRRRLPTSLPPDAPDGEIAWIGPYPDALLASQSADPEARALQRESVELAFIVALQELSPHQRAILLLRDVLRFSARETADLLDTTVAAANSALQRSRRILAGRIPERSQQDNLRRLGDERLQTLVARYVRAWERHDVDALVALLVADARFAMPPAPTWYSGRADIRAVLLGRPFQQEWRLMPTCANGQPAVGYYRWNDASTEFIPAGVDVLTLRGDRIAEITAFQADDLTAFGLPPRMAA
ncbi:sigma-70 family RNA polymerase sigma factor [Microbacterium lushaniae]|nr:sigma-70 family RNA polymerase sigma factor [Microbacterium lushaniae]KAA9157408.1 sigma-70 family RNA polymerase sigma factor [Microbacterium lushaniae]